MKIIHHGTGTDTAASVVDKYYLLSAADSETSALRDQIINETVVTGLVFRLNHARRWKLKETSIYLISVSLAALYVISQELKFHNLGGNNVYDVNDVIASVLGLVFMLVTMLFFGFFKKTGST